jgi:DNA-binding transcriptional MerR regulator
MAIRAPWSSIAVYTKILTGSKRIQQMKDFGLTLSEIRELFDLARRDRSGESVRKCLAERYHEKLHEAERRRSSLEEHIADLGWHIEQLDRVTDFFQCPGSSCQSCLYSSHCDIRLLVEGSESPN